MTSLQERRLKQTEQQIAFLEEQVQKKGLWFAIQFSYLTVILFYIIGYFIELLFEKTSVAEYLNNFSWIKFLGTWIFWFLFDYFFFVVGNRRTLQTEKRNLELLRKKYGLREETVP